MRECDDYEGSLFNVSMTHVVDTTLHARQTGANDVKPFNFHMASTVVSTADTLTLLACKHSRPLLIVLQLCYMEASDW